VPSISTKWNHAFYKLHPQISQIFADKSKKSAPICEICGFKTPLFVKCIIPQPKQNLLQHRFVPAKKTRSLPAALELTVRF
jgi:hypothetical protein